MTRIGKTLGNGAPLHGEIVIIVERCDFVDTPAEGTVVEDDSSLVALPGSICSVIDIFLLTTAKADESDYAVVLWANGVISQGDSWRRSCLTEDGGISSDGEVGSQRNDASNVKDDDLLATATYCSTEGTCAFVVEVGNVNNFTASSAGNISAMTLCAWEGWGLC